MKVLISILICATGPDRFPLIYSDFKYHNKNNGIRKAIKVREVRVINDL